MSLGYWFGAFYDKSYDADKRRKLFNIVGLSAITLFIFLRWTNLYGNPSDRGHFDSFSKNLISFLNPAKYPPSLMYVLMTLGVALIFLANSENLRGKVVAFFSTFGRVPFFWLNSPSNSIRRLRRSTADLFRSGLSWPRWPESSLLVNSNKSTQGLLREAGARQGAERFVSRAAPGPPLVARRTRACGAGSGASRRCGRRSAAAAMSGGRSPN